MFVALAKGLNLAWLANLNLHDTIEHGSFTYSFKAYPGIVVVAHLGCTLNAN
jgi:hypothetical protein